MSKIFVLLIISFYVFSEENHLHDQMTNIKAEEHGAHEEEGSHEEHGAHEEEGSHEEHGAHEEEGSHEEHGAHEEEGSHEEHGTHEEEGSHEGHGSSKAIGENKAIRAVDEIKGFMLSPEAFKSLEIKLTEYSGNSFYIDKETLVTSKEKKGVYRFRKNYFKFVGVEILREVNDKYFVKTNSILPTDQIVIKGTKLLRVTDVYSTDTAEYGHGH